MSLSKLKTKGFTLIELMIVVAIIGILAAVAVPKFADLVTKSKEASVKGSLGAVRSAISIYYGDLEGGYPGNLFVALTTANKYMPSQGGAPSLGAFTIPKNTNSNPGHNHGNITAATQVTQTVTATLTLDDADPITYSSLDGSSLINCTHNDSKNSFWSSY